MQPVCIESASLYAGCCYQPLSGNQGEIVVCMLRTGEEEGGRERAKRGRCDGNRKICRERDRDATG